jgi:hypothetical protein
MARRLWELHGLGSFGAIIIYRVLRGLGGTPTFAEGAIASPAAGSGTMGPEGPVGPAPDRPAREP